MQEGACVSEAPPGISVLLCDKNQCWEREVKSQVWLRGLGRGWFPTWDGACRRKGSMLSRPTRTARQGGHQPGSVRTPGLGLLLLICILPKLLELFSLIFKIGHRVRSWFKIWFPGRPWSGSLRICLFTLKFLILDFLWSWHLNNINSILMIFT